MYAMTGKLITQHGKRANLVSILTQASQVVSQIPECKMYIVCEDVSDENAIWVFEVWDDKQAHDDSLKNEQTRALINQARPLLAAAPDGAELKIIGGHGFSTISS
jgi:quinol monooxygenase YgiN